MPHTLSENLERLDDNSAEILLLTSNIADAITAKGGTVTANTGLRGMAAAVETIPTGGDSHFASNLTVTTEPGAVVTATRISIQLNVKAENGAPITITDGFTTLTGTGTGDWQIFWLPNTETWTVTSEVSGVIVSTTIDVENANIHSVDVSKTPGIFGVYWTGGSETTFTRTDDAVNFDNPDPYVNDGNHPGYSPFDNIWPWSGMRIVEKDGNSLVEIPKYWYKITRDGSSMKFQITNYETDGFKVSPAHQDRGDGVGERDFVYIGRYHCVDDTVPTDQWKSKSGILPQVSKTIGEFRDAIMNLGSGYYMNDFALFWTTRILYLVEFANWNSQITIGYGGGNSSTIYTMGYTDSMPYHTGTIASSRTTFDAKTQYRYIEGLWDNVFDWCDGIYFSGSTVYIHTNLLNYGSYTSGVSVGTRPTDWDEIKSFFIPSVSDLDWAMYTNTKVTDTSYSSYISDYCGYGSNGVTLAIGGWYNGKAGQYGMFFLDGSYRANESPVNRGSRLMYLPPNNS